MTKEKLGRPTKYKKEYDDQMYKFALLGATDEEAAAFFNIDVATFYRWRHDHPSFCEAIKEGKEKADSQVAKKLYNRALGYNYEEEKIETVFDELIGDYVEVSKVITKKHAPPDIAAMNIWLKNRRGRVDPAKGQKWADKHEHEHSGNLVTNITVLDSKTKKNLEKLEDD